MKREEKDVLMPFLMGPLNFQDSELSKPNHTPNFYVMQVSHVGLESTWSTYISVNSVFFFYVDYVFLSALKIWLVY